MSPREVGVALGWAQFLHNKMPPPGKRLTARLSTSLGDRGKDFAYGVIIDTVGQAAKSGALTPSMEESPSPPSICQAGSKCSWEVGLRLLSLSLSLMGRRGVFVYI